MTATCRCSVCGYRWFHCNCPDELSNPTIPENTFLFWRNQSVDDVELLMAHEQKVTLVRQQMEQAMAERFGWTTL